MSITDNSSKPLPRLLNTFDKITERLSGGLPPISPRVAHSQLACIERSNGDRLIVTFKEWSGAHYCDLRVHFVNDKGVVLPTKTGISIRMDEVFLIHDAIGEACKLAMGVKR